MSYQQFFTNARKARGPVFKKPREEMARDGQGEHRLRRIVRVKASRRRPLPSPLAVMGLLLSLGAGGAYLLHPEWIENLTDRIEVRSMGHAAAADAKEAEKSTTSKTGAEKPAAEKAQAGKTKGPDEHASIPDDMSHFEKLKQRKEELDAREKELTELEEELQRQKGELDKRIQQLEDIRSQIAQILKERVDVDQEKVAKLVDLYSNMKPKQAADIIGTINEELAVDVLARMKKKNAAEIMNLLPAEKARVLSEKYTGYRRNHPEPKG